MKDGYFLYQVDRTKIDKDPTKPGFGGGGGFGEVEYSNDELREYLQYGSGNYLIDTDVSSLTHGEAVLLGMICATKFSYKNQIIKKNDYSKS